MAPTEKPLVPLPHQPAAALFAPEVLEELQLAQAARETALKKLRTQVDNAGVTSAVADVDAQLRLHQGDGPTVPGLKAWLGKPEKDEAQTDLEDEIGKPDYRTWNLTVAGSRGLADKLMREQPPVEAIRTLQRLEAGEKERKPKPRDGVLKALRDKISGLQDDVQSLAEAPN